MKILFMLLIIVLAIPLYATTIQGETGLNSLRISIINNQEVGLNQAVSAPIYYHEGIIPRKQKLFSLLEFSAHNPDISIKMSTVISNHINKFGGRRIKSGRHWQDIP